MGGGNDNTCCTFGECLYLGCLKFLIGNQGNKWYETYISLGRRKSAFTIEFEASRGISWSGDIAIDSISMINCQKPSRCTGQLPSDTQR